MRMDPTHFYGSQLSHAPRRSKLTKLVFQQISAPEAQPCRLKFSLILHQLSNSVQEELLRISFRQGTHQSPAHTQSLTLAKLEPLLCCWLLDARTEALFRHLDAYPEYDFSSSETFILTLIHSQPREEFPFSTHIFHYAMNCTFKPAPLPEPANIICRGHFIPISGPGLKSGHLGSGGCVHSFAVTNSDPEACLTGHLACFYL